jgi:hypothetical protein
MQSRSRARAQQPVVSGAFHEAALELELSLASSTWPGPPPPVAPGMSSAFAPQPYTGPNPYAQPLQSSLRASSRSAAPPPAVRASAYPSPIHHHQGDLQHQQQQQQKIASTDTITRVQRVCLTPWRLPPPSRPTCGRSSTPLWQISVWKMMS